MKTKNILEYISSVEGELGDICSDFYYLYLKDKENPYRDFQIFLENWFDAESDNSILIKEYYSDDEYRKCIKEIGPVIGRVMSNLVEKNNPPDLFYRSLWDNINSDVLFDSDFEKICAVLFVILSPQIPYFQMDEALRMDDEEYRKISIDVEKWYKKALFALYRGYEQRTEVASQILAIFKEIPSEKQQVVYIANLIGHSRGRIHRLEEKIRKLQEAKEAHKE